MSSLSDDLENISSTVDDMEEKLNQMQKMMQDMLASFNAPKLDERNGKWANLISKHK